ncbi:MAG: hypothetical protein O7161_07025 [Wolbachia endosymbiont of Halictus tumulorum]|nr:hypothetical protein [Wolbachia endosymbiont of Halictus tumulorum]
MDTKISYAGILRRVLASVIDGALWVTIALVSLIFLNSDDVDGIVTESIQRIILMVTLLIMYIV